MAINKSLEARLDSAISAESAVTEMTKPLTNEPVDGMPVQQNLEFPEYEQEAGLGSIAPVVKKLKPKTALAPLLEKGARAKPEPKITADPPPIASTPADAAPAVTEAPKPKQKADITPTALDETQRLVQERKAMEAAGPAAGTDITPISNLAFDNEGLQATVRVMGENAAKNEPTMSLRSIKMRMMNAGVPENIANRILQNQPIESTVGSSELAKTVSGVVELHDQSAKMLDTLMEKMAAGQLDQAGQLELRQQMAFHNVITSSLKGVQVDVARSMNVFKRVKDAGPGFRPIDMRAILDEVGGEKALLQIANDYVRLESRKGKNQLLEVGLGQRLRDAWINTWQSNLLSDITPHAYSFVSGVLNTARAPIERLAAVPVGALRKDFSIRSLENLEEGVPHAAGKAATGDRFYLSDLQARLSGFAPGVMDAWVTLAKGGPKVRVPGMGVDFTLPTPFSKDYALRSSAKGDAVVAPLSGAAFSDVPVRLPFSGKELFRTPDFTKGFLGKGLDAMGYMYSVPFRAMRAADDFIGMIVSRMQLHEESWHIAQNEYDKFVVAGAKHDDALAETQRVVATFLDERPASLQASLDKARQQATFTEEFNRETKLNEFYWKTDQLFQSPVLKPFLPFSRAITQEFLHTSAATPGMNVISPKFWDAWNAGGKERDLAFTRLALGGMAGYVALQKATDNRITGSGPSDPQDRKSLEAIGWQKYSIIFSPGEISPEMANKLSSITKVTQGEGNLSGYTFVSYARFSVFSPILALGADFADAQKFHVGKPDEDEWSKLALAYAGSNMEYLKNMPSVQAVGELVDILRTKHEDSGEKVYNFFAKVGKQYLDVIYTGTPVIGSTNASVIAHIERLNDPLIRSTRMDQMNAPEHIRIFYEQMNRVKSRMPVFSEGLQAELDDIGRRRYAENNMFEITANAIPIVQASKGKRDPFSEAMVSIDHGVSRPRDTWDGIKLSATQFNRYKKLYGQEVLIDPALFVDTAVGPPMNLEMAVPFLLKEKENYEINEGRTFGKGDAQRFVDGIVKKYRRIAKLRMVGFDPSPELGQTEVPDLTEYGFLEEKVEFPELGAAIDRTKKFYSLYGK
jgi:hypothetical protein